MAVHGLPLDRSPVDERISATNRLLALDLVASGAQDREAEAILEVAAVPMIDWQPRVGAGFSTRINPGRPVPPRQWIAAGLDDARLREAPGLGDVLPELTRRINTGYVVGYNIGANWRLLRRSAPGLRVAGLIDVLRLARAIDPAHRHDLPAVIDQLALTELVDQYTDGARPGRALWNSVASVVLMTSLARKVFGPDASVAQLLAVAGVPAQRPRHLRASDWRSDLIPLRD
jgi:DNA polymerase-3 subunit epsilon